MRRIVVGDYFRVASRKGPFRKGLISLNLINHELTTGKCAKSRIGKMTKERHIPNTGVRKAANA